jgi:SH3 domain-containing protein
MRDMEAAVSNDCAQCGRALARVTRYCPYCRQPPAPRVVEAPAVKFEPVVPSVREAVAPVREAAATVVELPAVAPPQAPPSAPQKPATPPAAAHPAPVSPTAASSVGAKPKRSRRWWFVVAGAAAILIVVKVLFSAAPDTQAPPVAAITVYSVRDDTTVRNAPTTLNSSKVATLQRGASLQGDWLDRNAAGFRWFKIAAGPFSGGYVWERSLSAAPPPQLLQAVGLYKAASRAADVRVAPQVDAAVVMRIRAGQSVFVVGAVDGGWYELRLKRGGVGYAQDQDLR